MSQIPHPDRDVTFTPADFERFERRDLSGTTCIVFDVLRATTTMLSALRNGASSVFPVATISDAVQLRKNDPEILLAGERDGFRISAALSGGTDFDMGNSPREFIRTRVEGRRIAMTTTNGTRALQACRNAERVLIGSLINRGATAQHLASIKPARLLLVCSGTGEDAAMEDVLGAGALAGLIDELLPAQAGQKIGDGWRMATALFATASANPTLALSQTRNGRRLAGIPELAEDLPVCAALDSLDLVASMNRQGVVQQVRQD